MKRIALVLAGLLVIIAGSAIAQQETATQLEDFAIKEGAIIVKVSYAMGQLDIWGYTSVMEVAVVTSYEVGIPDTFYGMTIRIGGSGSTKTSLFDFGEVVSLSEALDYMVIQSEEWDLENREYTEVYFKIRDDFRIGFFQEETAQTVFAQSGKIAKTTVNWKENKRVTATEILRNIKALVDKGLDKLKSLTIE